MRHRRPALVLAAAAALIGPPVAAADVYLAIPPGFLGGPIGQPLPRLQPPDDARPATGLPSRSPADVADACQGETPSDCMVWGPGAADEPVPLPEANPSGPGAEIVGDDTQVPVDPDAPVEVEDPAVDPVLIVPPPDQTAPMQPAVAAEVPDPAQRVTHGGLLFPKAADWLPWQRPTMRWRSTPGAGYYNLQVFRGSRRVLNAWPTRNRLTVPLGVLRQGRSYVWVVWAGLGRRGEGRYAARPVGRSTFAVTLRPRIVFRVDRARPGRVRAEVRPHIPRGILRLERPRALVDRVPAMIRIDRRGRFTLPVGKRAAERLDAGLVQRGPRPPIGLRR